MSEGDGMMIDRFEACALLAFVLVLVVTLAPIIERTQAALAYFDLMERGFR